MSIDARLADRRKMVAEENAKRNMTRLLRFLLLVVLAGSLVWLAFSPWLSIALVEVDGVRASSTNEVLVDSGVVAGTPMIAVRSGALERALLADPWVAQATVRLHWPDVVTVEVVEREPAAWVHTAGGWTRRALDGVALPSEADPDPEMGWIEMPDLPEAEAESSTELIGAIEFVASLPLALRPGTVVTMVDEELWATVSGYQVRLGRPVDMGEKALSLSALVDKGIPEGSTLVLIAPTKPAVLPPEAAAAVKRGDQ